jgi:hypothetical protein
MGWKERLEKLPPAERARVIEENRLRAKARRERLKNERSAAPRGRDSAGGDTHPAAVQGLRRPDKPASAQPSRVNYRATFTRYVGPFTPKAKALGIPWYSELYPTHDYIDQRLEPTEDVRRIPRTAEFMSRAPGPHHRAVRLYVCRDPRTGSILRSVFLGDDEAAEALRRRIDRQLRKRDAVDEARGAS